MPQATQIAILGAVAVALVALGLWIVFQPKSNPEKREHQRRETLHRRGRLGEAFIVEVTPDMIHYTYAVHGVRYTAAQDVSALAEYLPRDHERLIGVASIKYFVNNPANSILICEEWNGLRAMPGGRLLTDGDAVGHQA
jgi:hypothetical protein